MTKSEKYDLEIGEGLDYDILDKSFNATSQAFILKLGLTSGMNVLDVGCGAGVMTSWLAKQVGPEGTVTAIDNSEQQLNVTIQRLKKENLSNVKTKVMSAYDIGQLNEKFDMIYCRFVLHHLHSPRKTLKLFFENIKTHGIYMGEEGIISAAFAYPPTFAWQGHIPSLNPPESEVDDVGRDSDIGIKLLYLSKQAGFEILDAGLVQPLLWKKEQKKGLLDGLIAYKKTDLEHGTTELEWKQKFDETMRIINDNNQMIAFYGSCQIGAIKPI